VESTSAALAAALALFSEEALAVFTSEARAVLELSVDNGSLAAKGGDVRQR